MSHVIAAVSTGNQVSAIGILRLTGDGCAQVAGKVFKLTSGMPLQEAPNRKLMLGNILPYEISEMEVQDIDTVTDWEIAEMKYRILRGNVNEA